MKNHLCLSTFKWALFLRKLGEVIYLGWTLWSKCNHLMSLFLLCHYFFASNITCLNLMVLQFNGFFCRQHSASCWSDYAGKSLPWRWCSPLRTRAYGVLRVSTGSGRAAGRRWSIADRDTCRCPLAPTAMALIESGEAGRDSWWRDKAAILRFSLEKKIDVNEVSIKSFPGAIPGLTWEKSKGSTSWHGTTLNMELRQRAWTAVDLQFHFARLNVIKP